MAMAPLVRSLPSAMMSILTSSISVCSAGLRSPELVEVVCRLARLCLVHFSPMLSPSAVHLSDAVPLGRTLSSILSLKVDLLAVPLVAALVALDLSADYRPHRHFLTSALPSSSTLEVPARPMTWLWSALLGPSSGPVV